MVWWIKGHIVDSHQEYLEKKVVTEWEAYCHHQADVLAGEEVLRISLPIDIQQQAAGRKALGMLVSRMFLDIWTEKKKDMLQALEEDALEEQYEVEEQAMQVGREPETPDTPPPPKRYQELTKEYPAYPWSIPDSDPMSPGPKELGTMTTHHRGKTLKATFSFPTTLWEPFLEWRRRLRFRERSVNQPTYCSFAELAVDYEVWTGERLRPCNTTSGAATWAQKARILHCLWATADRHVPALRIAGLKRTRVTTLALWNVPKLPGINMRPFFLAHHHTDLLIVRNAEGYSRKERAKGGDIEAAKGFLNQPVSYEGLSYAPDRKNMSPVHAKLQMQWDKPNRRVYGKKSVTEAARVSAIAQREARRSVLTADTSTPQRKNEPANSSKDQQNEDQPLFFDDESLDIFDGDIPFAILPLAVPVIIPKETFPAKENIENPFFSDDECLKDGEGKMQTGHQTFVDDCLNIFDEIVQNEDCRPICPDITEDRGGASAVPAPNIEHENDTEDMGSIANEKERVEFAQVSFPDDANFNTDNQRNLHYRTPGQDSVSVTLTTEPPRG